MGVASLMSRIKGEEAHQAYKEGDGSHRKRIDLLFSLWFVKT